MKRGPTTRIHVRGGLVPAGNRMFNCKESIGQLLALLDGEMTPDEQRHLEEHLRGCGPCEEFLRSYRATPGLCKKALAARMPSEVGARLTAYLRSRCKPP